MIDCAAAPAPNLAITQLTPQPDVWVAGVPVVVRVTVKNYATTEAKNVTLAARVIRYDADLAAGDPTRRVSGTSEALPAMLIDQLPAGGEETKSFQVYITEPGTHAVEVSIPEDALSVDNRRVCTLPLSDVERVLVIDGDVEDRAAFHIASVLNPGGQVRTGAVPDVQPPATLRSITADQLARYRAVYLADVSEIGDSAAEALQEYVEQGGGLFWFLGAQIEAATYNRVLGGNRRLLPGQLQEVAELPVRAAEVGPDVILGSPHPLTEPLASVGDAAFAQLGLSRSWTLAEDEQAGEESSDAPVRQVLRRRDGRPLVIQHEVGRGRVVTSLTGLDTAWTNWPGDPTFVVFMLQANAHLWSAASPQVERLVEQGIRRPLPADTFVGEATYLPPVREPPRVPLQWAADGDADDRALVIDPKEQVIAAGADVDTLLQPGIGELVVTTLDGRSRLSPIALSIDAGESDLSRTPAEEIRRSLRPVDVRFVTAGELAEQYAGPTGSTTLLVLLALLAMLLAIEQALGYFGSYHRPVGEAIEHAAGLATSHVGVAGRRHLR